MTIRVLIADDQALVRGGLAMILGAQPDLEVVAEAEDGAAAVRAALEHHPDVVLMDLQMPVLDGIGATRQLVGVSPARVLILTTFDLDRHVFDAVRAGASGFLLKDTPPARLCQAVRDVASGETLLAPKITRRLLQRYATGAAPPPPALARLTPREREVLEQVARGLSNDEIARALHLSVTTVKTHLTRVLTKLDLRDRVQAVVFAYEYGVIEPGRPAG